MLPSEAQASDQAEVIRELWHRGKLSYKLHAGQRIIDTAFRKVTGQLFVGNCSRQWGKSFWAVTKAVELALATPNGRIKYGTAFHTDLIEFILPAFEAVLEDCPPELMPRYKVQGSKWIFKNGAQIKLVGLDRNPNAMRGNVIDLIVLDEVGFVMNLDYLYKSIIIPATTHRPNCKIIMISTPPQTPAHPFAEFIARADLEAAYIKLDIYSNPMIGTDTIDRLARELGGKGSIDFRRECLCELVIDTSIAILGEWNSLCSAVVVQKSSPVPAFYKPLVAIDLALIDNVGVIFGYWDFERAKAVQQAELLLNGVNSKQLTERCLKIEKDLWGEDLKPMRWADGSLYTLNDICSVHHYSVSMVKKDVVEAQVNSLKLMLQGHQIEINATCKQTIHQCATGTWNKSRTEFARIGSNHNDLLAALVYFVRHLNRENPFPRDYMLNRETMMPGRALGKHVGNAEAIRKAFKKAV